MHWEKARREFEIAYWTEIITYCGHSINQVAKLSGMHRQNVYKIIRRLGIELPPYDNKGHVREGRPNPLRSSHQQLLLNLRRPHRRLSPRSPS